MNIKGEPMIVHVWRRAVESDSGRVVVACDQVEIARAIKQVGGEAVITDYEHTSGSDRVFEALQIVDPMGNHDVVVNFQGDMPTANPSIIPSAVNLLSHCGGDIATLACVIKEEEELNDANVVKVVASIQPGSTYGRALYFTRTKAPWGDGVYLHHVGIYAFWRKALEHFISLKPAPLEQRESLEQLRALEAGMFINVGLVDTVPLGVDTPSDLERVRKISLEVG